MKKIAIALVLFVVVFQADLIWGDPIANQFGNQKNVYFKVGLGLAARSISEPVFADTYGKNLLGGRLELSFNIAQYEIFFGMEYFQKEGHFPGFEETVDLKQIPVYFGFKYYFLKGKKINPFAGLALSSCHIEEQVDGEAKKMTSDPGFSLMGGVNYQLRKNLEIFAHLRYDSVKLETEVDDHKIDLSGAGFCLGISMRLQRKKLFL